MLDLVQNRMEAIELNDFATRLDEMEKQLAPWTSGAEVDVGLRVAMPEPTPFPCSNSVRPTETHEQRVTARRWVLQSGESRRSPWQGGLLFNRHPLPPRLSCF